VVSSATDRTTAAERPAPADREPVTRPRVLEAALAVIDRDGVEGLSMRKLGAEVGVEAMSLYNHVADKDDVLDGVVALLWEEVAERTAPGPTWQQQVRALAAAIRATAHAHPHAYPLVLTRGVLPSELLEISGRLLATLQEAGFGDIAGDAMVALGSHATSQALAELSWYGPREDGGDASAGEPAGASDGTAGSPETLEAEAVRALAECDTDRQFAFSLELLIDGLEARLAQAG
jgi:AcrR family transcriptional regulator